MKFRRFSSSTMFMKQAAFALVLVFILHLVGFAIPRWSTLKPGPNLRGTYHVGLWLNCNCSSELSSSRCQCMSKDTATGSLKTVQILEIIGLVGLMISGITCLTLLFAKEDAIRHEKRLKVLNIAIVIASGICIVIGAVVYAVVCNNEYKELFSYVNNVQEVMKGPRLGSAFIICTTAGGVSLLLCGFVLVMDYRSKAQQMQTMPGLYSNQDRFLVHRQVIMKNQDPRLVELPSELHSDYVLPIDHTEEEGYTHYF